MKLKMTFDEKKINDKISRMTEVQKEGFQKLVYTSAYKIEANAKELVTVFTGALRASINVKTFNKGLTADIGSGVLTGEPLIYAEAIEFGRKPGSFPAYDEASGLYRWVKLKLGIVGKMTKSVAFLIARKIFKEGTKPQPYLKPAFDKEKRNFESKIKDVLNKVR